MPERKGSANAHQTIVKGNFVNHWYELFGQQQYDQFFLDDVRWQKFLIHPDTRSFSFMHTNQSGTLITLRREKLKSGDYWYAYKKHQKRLHKVYVGKSEELTYEKLVAAVAALQAKIKENPA